jgi:hypothetical protein
MDMVMAMATITTVTNILIEITIDVTRMTVIRVQSMDRIIGGENLELQTADTLPGSATI